MTEELRIQLRTQLRQGCATVFDILFSEWCKEDESDDLRRSIIKWARGEPRVSGIGLFPGLIRLEIRPEEGGKPRVWASDKHP